MEKIDLIIEKYFVKEKLFDEIDRIQDEGGKLIFTKNQELKE